MWYRKPVKNNSMRPETQTKEMLLKAAKEQFMEKGYMGASLRTICKEAGVTTGALYFSSKIRKIYLELW